MTSAADDDSLLAVAFSLHANPGSYALLIGAGVAAASGIPTAWDVLADLTPPESPFHAQSPIS